jgi:hypothetical protein
MSFWSKILRKTTDPVPVQWRPAPIIAEPYARGVEAEFRLPDDPEHVVRINQKPPRGLSRKIEGFVPVAGIARPERTSVVQSFIHGTNRRVELQRTPDNLVDPNAIAVIGHWREGDNELSGQLGYLPAEVAAQISKELEGALIGATLKVIYVPLPGRSPGLRLDIWAPRRKLTQVETQPYQQDVRVPSDAVERNLLGMRLEKEGLIENAIVCYEENVREGFSGNHPYDRLAVIFRKRGDRTREIAVLKRGIEVFEQLVGSGRSDVVAKLERFRQRLEKVEAQSSAGDTQVVD